MIYRVLALNIGAILVLASLIYGARQWGLSRPHQPLPNELFNEYRVYEVFNEASPVAKKGTFLLSICAEGQTGQWVVCDASRRPLRSWLEENTPSFLILQLMTDSSGYQSLVDLIEQNSLSPRTAFVSAFQGGLHQLRMIKPRWSYGLMSGALAKVFILETIYLEPLADIRADFLVLRYTDFSHRKSRRWAKELSRRQLWTLLDVAQLHPSEVSIPRELKPVLKGVVTNRFSDWSFQLPAFK